MSVMFRPKKEQEFISELREKFIGVAPAIVVNNNDPDRIGQVEVRFPWLFEDEGRDVSAWARFARPSAGAGYGMWQLPRIGEEVLVAFEHGNFTVPYVIGRLWNGVDRPPLEGVEKGDKVEVYKTKAGHLVIFDDEQKRIQMKHADGHEIVFETSEGLKVSKIVCDKLELNVQELSIHASTSVVIDSPDTIVGQNGQTVKLSGGGAAAARQGDAVAVDSTSHQGTVTAGSGTVQIGG